MREFVRLQTAILLRRFAYEIGHAARSPNSDAIHDLRVSIRRFNVCLRVFAQFYPGHSWKKMRRRLADLMDACATVRDLDIAIDLLGKAGLPPGSPVVGRLEVERGKAERELLAELRRWKSSAVSRKWKSQLGL